MIQVEYYASSTRLAAIKHDSSSSGITVATYTAVVQHTYLVRTTQEVQPIIISFGSQSADGTFFIYTKL